MSEVTETTIQKPITVNVPEWLDEKLAKMAARQLISKSAMIRMMLDRHVAEAEAEDAKGN